MPSRAIHTPSRPGTVRYLCLIHWDEHKLATLPADELNTLNAAHLDFNDELRRSGHYVVTCRPPAGATELRTG
jgi:hypothetical protein